MSDRSMFGPNWTVSPTGNGNEHHLFDSRGKVAATGYKGEKLQYIADCVNRIKELEAIVAKLPHTADGVPVVPGMVVWNTYGGQPTNVRVMGYICNQAGDMSCLYFVGGFDVMPNGHYSTKKAAEEASQS